MDSLTQIVLGTACGEAVLGKKIGDKALAWFSNHYYRIYKIGDNEYQYNDLRYPVTDETNSTSSVFRFRLYEENNEINMKPFERNEDIIRHSELVSESH